MTCPKCGGTYVKRSGFFICRKCGHQHGTQDLMPQYRHISMSKPVSPVDEYEREVDMPDRPGKLNRELKF